MLCIAMATPRLAPEEMDSTVAKKVASLRRDTHRGNLSARRLAPLNVAKALRTRLDPRRL